MYTKDALYALQQYGYSMKNTTTRGGYESLIASKTIGHTKDGQPMIVEHFSIKPNFNDRVNEVFYKMSVYELDEPSAKSIQHALDRQQQDHMLGLN